MLLEGKHVVEFKHLWVLEVQKLNDMIISWEMAHWSLLLHHDNAPSDSALSVQKFLGTVWLEYSICKIFFLNVFSCRLLKISLINCSCRNQLGNSRCLATVQICFMMLYFKMQWQDHLRIWRISSVIALVKNIKLINQ